MRRCFLVSRQRVSSSIPRSVTLLGIMWCSLATSFSTSGPAAGPRNTNKVRVHFPPVPSLPVPSPLCPSPPCPPPPVAPLACALSACALSACALSACALCACTLSTRGASCGWRTLAFTEWQGVSRPPRGVCVARVATEIVGGVPQAFPLVGGASFADSLSLSCGEPQHQRERVWTQAMDGPVIGPPCSKTLGSGVNSVYHVRLAKPLVPKTQGFNGGGGGGLQTVRPLFSVWLLDIFGTSGNFQGNRYVLEIARQCPPWSDMWVSRMGLGVGVLFDMQPEVPEFTRH
uniref:Uncharacterized protein n=1 Tax=Knipowitschia caucasica TaxID=637954 RepID=A0AAV2KFM9_KNICA